MYNRYIPEDVSYTRIEPPPRPQSPGPGPRNQPPPLRFSDFLKGREGLAGLIGGREGGALSGVLKSLHLDNIDSGDVLLLLIMLYLMKEGDDMELVIALGLILIMGLGDDKKEN